MNSPSLGRIVLYRHIDDGEPAPAMITRVWSARCVNLKVQPDGRPIFDVTSVECEDAPGQGGRWSWPPRG